MIFFKKWILPNFYDFYGIFCFFQIFANLSIFALFDHFLTPRQKKIFAKKKFVKNNEFAWKLYKPRGIGYRATAKIAAWVRAGPLPQSSEG